MFLLLQLFPVFTLLSELEWTHDADDRQTGHSTYRTDWAHVGVSSRGDSYCCSSEVKTATEDDTAGRAYIRKYTETTDGEEGLQHENLRWGDATKEYMDFRFLYMTKLAALHPVSFLRNPPTWSQHAPESGAGERFAKSSSILSIFGEWTTNGGYFYSISCFTLDIIVNEWMR